MSKIVINYGIGIKKTTYECLKTYDAASLIEKGKKIIIKPNLINSTKASHGATTHPEVVEAIIEYLHEYGHEDIEIVESSWVGGNTEEAFSVCGYEKLANKYGIPLSNAVKQSFKSVTYKNIKMNVCDKIFGNAFLINVPVLKAHCQTQITCCIKNLKGLITNNDKRNFHVMGLHEPIAALGAVVRPGLNVVDGICGDLTFEEGGNPVETNMIIAGEDPLLIDTFAAQFMGYDPKDIKYLVLAEKFGVGEFFSEDSELIEINDYKKPPLDIRPSEKVGMLTGYINEKEACSACYSALVRGLYKASKRDLNIIDKKKISVGQGFKGVKGFGLGFGKCTSCFDNFVEGCPPKAIDLLNKLREM